MVPLGHAADSMISIVQIAALVRSLARVPRGAIVTPRVLAEAFGLTPIGRSQPRFGLVGTTIYFDERLTPEQQDYQIARWTCAYLLRRFRCIRDLSEHELACEICGVCLPAVQLRLPVFAL